MTDRERIDCAVWPGGPERGDGDATRHPGRRAFLSLGVGAFVVAALPAALRRRPGLIRRRIPIMGTVADIAVVHRDERYARGAIAAALAELDRVDRLMSRYRPDSDVGRANRLAAAGPVVIAPETAEALGGALRWAWASDGRFDPCLARATALWDVRQRTEPPPREAVRALAGRGLYRRMEVRREGGRDVVVYTDPAVGIDLGGIGKGYAVDRAVDALRAWGIADGLVNLGGDLYALGSSENGDPWTVGIRSPEEPDRLIDSLEVSDRAVATSGDYMQYFEHDGTRYHHLLDPRTAGPVRGGARTVTVAADRCIDADAGATAVFGGASHRVLRSAPGAELLHTA